MNQEERRQQLEQYTKEWSDRQSHGGWWPDLIEWFSDKAPGRAVTPGVISTILWLEITSMVINDAVEKSGGWGEMAWDQFVGRVADGVFREVNRNHPAAVLVRMSLLKGHNMGPAQIAPDTDPGLLEFYQLLADDGILELVDNPVSSLEISESVYAVFGPAIMGIWRQSESNEDIRAALLEHWQQHGPIPPRAS